jgi:hypothetical protein
VTVDDLADAFLLAAILPPLIYIALLFARSRWTAERATRTIALAAVGTVGFLVQAAVTIYYGADYTGRPWVRLAVYGLLFIGWSAAVIGLDHYQRKGRG